jgi:hypothetical protein
MTTTITVAVTPAITVRDSNTALGGRVEPAIADLPIRLERRIASNWLTIRATHATSNGYFQLQPPHATGLYRIRTAPTTQLLAGTSAPFTLHPQP